MSSSSLWSRFRSSAYRDVPFVALGLFIGWNFDISCVVKGNSMLPTLHPSEYLLFLPYTLLVAKRYVGAPLVHPGDVVVVKVTNELSVCKRITKMTTYREEAQQWGEEFFTDVDPSYFDVAEPPPREETEWYEALSKSSRSRDWDPCVDRVANPSMWLWLEGDNKDDSFDSRSCGAVPIECLRGRVVGVIWPTPHLVASSPRAKQ